MGKVVSVPFTLMRMATFLTTIVSWMELRATAEVERHHGEPG